MEMEATSGAGALGSQRCAPLGVWQGPHPGEVSGSFQGPSRVGCVPEVRHKDRTGHPGSRRLLTPWAARGWRLPSCRARPPRGPRAAPCRPTTARLPHTHRTSSGLHLGRADTVIAPMHAAVPLPPRRQGHGGAMCRPCAADKLRGAFKAHKARAVPAPASLPPPEGNLHPRFGERRAGGGTLFAAPRRPALCPAPPALHESIGAGRSEDVTSYLPPPPRSGWGIYRQRLAGREKGSAFCCAWGSRGLGAASPRLRAALRGAGGCVCVWELSPTGLAAARGEREEVSGGQ